AVATAIWSRALGEVPRLHLGKVVGGEPGELEEGDRAAPSFGRGRTGKIRSYNCDDGLVAGDRRRDRELLPRWELDDTGRDRPETWDVDRGGDVAAGPVSSGRQDHHRARRARNTRARIARTDEEIDS